MPVPTDMARKALEAALAAKMAIGKLAAVKLENLPVKTKEAAGLLPKHSEGLLIVVGANNYSLVQRVMRNLPKIMVMRFDQVGTADILQAQQVWIEESVWTEFFNVRLKKEVAN